MKGRKKPHTHKNNGITYTWNYDISCMLPIQELDNCKHITILLWTARLEGGGCMIFGKSGCRMMEWSFNKTVFKTKYDG